MQEQGKRIPVLENAPIIAPEAVVYWEAYQTLSSMRISISGEPQPIPFSEIRAYADFLGYRSDDEAGDMFGIIRALDALYISHAREEKSKTDEEERRRAEAASRSSRRRR